MTSSRPLPAAVPSGKTPEVGAGPALAPGDPIACSTLHAVVAARVCLARQCVSDAQHRSTQRWRGEGLSFPTCVSERCAAGRRVREALDPERTATWRGEGPGGRFEPSRRSGEKTAQLAARAKLLAEGMLDEVPTVDADSDLLHARGVTLDGSDRGRR